MCVLDCGCVQRSLVACSLSVVCVLNGSSVQGCFDIMHAGHYNALRQAKAMFSGMGVPVVLVAGAHDSFRGENISS